VKLHQNNPDDSPVARTVSCIGGKWKPIILTQLLEGNMRFGKFVELLPKISRKILTQQLKELENDNLIIRRKFNEKPPRVEYEISERGKTLIPILQAMYDWGKKSDEERQF
jgi:DNA-binding HxlR family transcriptional regulator